MGMRIRGGAARQLQGLFDLGAIGTLSDLELIARYLGRDGSAEAAFEALVDRHSRMVLRVCDDVLGNSHEAQDAAQATFFILARKAGSIRNPETLPSWLHGTARRVAARALRDSIRRRHHERQKAQIGETNPDDSRPDRNWSELHEELDRLPDRYRVPIILCDLTGLTHQQAADKLGCPPRTLETRLHRGRERLKWRLIRRGFAPSVALVGAHWGAEAQAGLPTGWVTSTVATALAISKSEWAVGSSSTVAIGLARGYLKGYTMFTLKWIIGSALLLGLAWQQVPSPAHPAPVPAQAEPTAKVVQKEPARALPKAYTHPINVTGRTVDRDGKPIGGARVYMASRKAAYKRLAETRSDAEGRFEFHSLPLPILRSDKVKERDQGAFQIFGEADGFGFVYRPVKVYYPLPRPIDLIEDPEFRDPPESYEAGAKIELDLKFPPPARLIGLISDDRGQPIPNAALEIRQCISLIDRDDVRPGWSFETFNETDSAPGSMKLRTTDDQGRFSFNGMQPDCRYWIWIRAKGFPYQTFQAATTADPQEDHDGSPVLTGEIRITMKIPNLVPIKLIFADTRMPAARALVQAGGDLATTDDAGRATLRLSKGTYRMSNLPAVGTPYLETESELEVGDKPPNEPLICTLERAANLEVIVTDEATGKGLAGVDLWHSNDDNPRSPFTMRSWQPPRLIRADSPRSDEQGRLKVFIAPGKQLVGVGRDAYPVGYEVVENDGQEVECRAGETTTVRFKMRKKP